MDALNDPTEVVHSTFKIERQFKHVPAKVFAAFSTADRKKTWFSDMDPPGWTTEAYGLDFQVGGREHGTWKSPDGNRISLCCRIPHFSRRILSNRRGRLETGDRKIFTTASS